jgi:hypothetical protein
MSKNAPMITDSNQACLAKMTGRRVQEVLNDFPFSNLLEQIDSKIWRLHLLIVSRRRIVDSIITS